MSGATREKQREAIMESNNNKQVTTGTETVQPNLDKDKLLKNGLCGEIWCFRDCEARCRSHTGNRELKQTTTTTATRTSLNKNV